MRNINNISKPKRPGVMVRFPDALFARYKGAADSVGITFPDWMRMAAASYARNWKTPEGKKPEKARTAGSQNIFGDSSPPKKVTTLKLESTPEQIVAYEARQADLDARQATLDAVLLEHTERQATIALEKEAKEEKDRIQAEWDEMSASDRARAAMKESLVTNDE